MRAIVCPDYGPPEILTVEDRPTPEPGPGQVLVQHKAWGINYVDVLMCAGGYQLKPPVPFVPGLEACGDVMAVGAGVEDFAVGDRVSGEGHNQTYARYQTDNTHSSTLVIEQVTNNQTHSCVYFLKKTK